MPRLKSCRRKTAAVYEDLARVHLQCGDLPEARHYFEQAILIRTERGERHFPETGRAMADLELVMAALSI
jgi:Tfp pilus assembly protein PilF